MTDVNRTTLENNGPLFIRDVLRENLVDPIGSRSASEWIVKGKVKKESISFPMVVIDQSKVDDRRLTFRDVVDTKLTLGLMVWAKTQEERDELADDIKEILAEDTNTDGTDTMVSRGLTLNSFLSTDDDGYIQGFSELIRIKNLDVELQYIG